jgi:nucleoside-diphosphate kinase
MPLYNPLTPPSFKLAAIKLTTPSKEHLEKHYEDLSSKPFFPGLIACAPPLPPPLPIPY